jgi:hypothetical protein
MRFAVGARKGRSDYATAFALAVLALITAAWLVYRPDRYRPFHLLDFSEFVPRLAAETGMIDQLTALLDYYKTQGRFNVLAYAFLVAKWNAFEWWTPGWQLSRAGLMVVLVYLTYLLLRRLGASRLGALAGASVYYWSPPATDGWVRLTMGEPLGAAISLMLSLRAVDYQRRSGWKREIGLFAAGTFAIVWTKELMAPGLLLPLTLALTLQRDGKFALPPRSSKNFALVGVTMLAALLAMVPVVVIYAAGGDSAYASMYGRGVQSLSGLLAIWIATLIPFNLIAVPTNVFWTMAIVSFLALVSLGWRNGLRSVSTRHRAAWLLGIACLTPLAGIAVYAPNPWYAGFYSIPYLIGAAMLIGFAATWLADQHPDGRFIAIAGCFCIMIYGALSAATFAARADAQQRRDDRIIRFIADVQRPDLIQFASERPPAEDWLGFGPAMQRMAIAQQKSWPNVRNVSCAAVTADTVASRPLTINLDATCRFKGNQRSITQYYRRPDLRRFRIVIDSVHATVLPSLVKTASP